MKIDDQLLPEPSRIREVGTRTADEPSGGTIVATRDHDLIKQWAARHGALPATGEATSSGPATLSVNDGGAGIRFNFPGAGLFRPISWEEWLDNFDRHECAFVFEKDPDSGPPSNRYRIVRARDWEHLLS